MFKSLSQRFGSTTIAGKVFVINDYVLTVQDDADEKLIKQSPQFNASIVEVTDEYSRSAEAYRESIKQPAVIIFLPSELQKLAKLPTDAIKMIHDNGMALYEEHFGTDDKTDSSKQDADVSDPDIDTEENKDLDTDAWPTEQELLDVKTKAKMKEYFDKYEILNYDPALTLRELAAIVWAFVQAKQGEEKRQTELKEIIQ